MPKKQSLQRDSTLVGAAPGISWLANPVQRGLTFNACPRPPPAHCPSLRTGPSQTWTSVPCWWKPSLIWTISQLLLVCYSVVHPVSKSFLLKVPKNSQPALNLKSDSSTADRYPLPFPENAHDVVEMIESLLSNQSTLSYNDLVTVLNKVKDVVNISVVTTTLAQALVNIISDILESDSDLLPFTNTWVLKKKEIKDLKI